jgi:aspartate racemase
MLRKRVRQLSQVGVGTLALACNTAHVAIVDLKQETSVPFVSISKVVADEVLRRGYKRVGLLASPVTIYSGVYQHSLLKRKVDLVVPEEKDLKLLGKSIKEIVAGVFKPSKERLLKIADKLKKQKAEALILGCTELPLVFPKNYSLPTLDSLEILAKALLKRYYQKDPPSSRCNTGTTAR